MTKTLARYRKSSNWHARSYGLPLRRARRRLGKTRVGRWIATHEGNIIRSLCAQAAWLLCHKPALAGKAVENS